jgi:hypothetical protein
MYEQQPAQVIQMLYMSPDAPPDAPPVAHLELHSDGLACKLCQGLPKILCSPGSMRTHLKEMHGWNKNRPKGRQRYSKRHEYSSLDEVTRPVYYQTFYKAGGLRRFFEVCNPDSFDTAASHPRPHPEPELSLRQRVEQDLTKKAQAIRDKAPTVALPHQVDISPWIEMTRWPQYLQDQDLLAVAPLADLPPRRCISQQSGDHDAIMRQLLAGFDRLIEDARESILTEKVNICCSPYTNIAIPEW